MTYDEGIYSARIVDAGLGESTEKRTPQITLKIDILGKQEKDGAGVPQIFQCPPGFRTINLYMTEKTQEFTIQKLRDAGWQGDDFDSIVDMKGIECFVSCKHEVATKGEHIGQTFDRFDLGVPTFKPIEHDTGVAKKLNALFGKMLKGVKPKPVATVAAAVNDKIDDREDDLPF